MVVYQDDSIVSVASQYPWVYDTSHQYYKDVLRKRNSWKEIAGQLNMTGKISIF